jgi:hypothetical protein
LAALRGPSACRESADHDGGGRRRAQRRSLETWTYGLASLRTMESHRAVKTMGRSRNANHARFRSPMTARARLRAPRTRRTSATTSGRRRTPRSKPRRVAEGRSNVFRCRDCRRQILERNRARHEQRCPKRKMRCPECGHEHLSRDRERHLRDTCFARRGRACRDCRLHFTSQAEYARHVVQRHHKCHDSLPSTIFTRSGEITHPDLVATGHVVQGGRPGSGRRA